MTHSGRILSFSRHGLLRRNKSFLAQCSFETTADVLEKAAQHAEKDLLQGFSKKRVYCFFRRY